MAAGPPAAGPLIPVQLTAQQINLVQESWRWIFFDRPLQETAMRFFLDFYFKQNPDCLTMFGMKTPDNRTDAFTVHALTVMHSFKYAVEHLDDPGQYQRLFQTVGKTHMRFGLTEKHMESMLDQWIVFVKARNPKVFDGPTLEAWTLAGRTFIDQILSGMRGSLVVVPETVVRSNSVRSSVEPVVDYS